MAQALRSIHCCRGDDDSDSESSSGSDARKPIPEWARGRALMQQLASQVQQDPDEVFQQHRKTCSLDEVFGASGMPKASIATCLMSEIVVPHGIQMIRITYKHLTSTTLLCCVP